MFFNSPDDLVAMASAFFGGITMLMLGTAAFYGIRNAIMDILKPKSQMAVRNRK